jgi:hypothetical protein
VWTLPALLVAPPLGTTPTSPAYKIVSTWMVQPIHARPATLAATCLGVGGLLAYAVLGPAGPRRS